MSEQLEAKWYVIHTYSGYEKKVKTTLDKMVENRGLQEMIQEVQVPTEDVIEVKDGKKKVVQRKKFPVMYSLRWYITRRSGTS